MNECRQSHYLENVSRHNYQDAIQAYGRVLMFEPRIAEVWHNKAIALNKMGRNEDALDAYDKAIQIDQDDGLAWFYKGRALEALHSNAEAKAAFAKAEELGYSDSPFISFIRGLI